MATKNAIDSTIPIEVSKGGSGAISLTDHGVLVGSGTGAVTALSVGTTGELLVGVTGADCAFGASANADFTFGGANSGSTRILTVDNTSNTASSSSELLIQVAGTSSGDPFISWEVDGVTAINMGLDNSDSDSLKIDGGTIGSNTYFKCTTAGEITKPLQPAFAAYADNQTDVTGDGTTYTVIFTNEIFDQNNDFDGTSTFTAPVTGRYQLNFVVRGDDFTSSHTGGRTSIVTSNRTYYSSYYDFGAIADVNGNLTLQLSVLADMDASDTAVVQIVINSGTKVVDINGAFTFFNGFLAC